MSTLLAADIGGTHIRVATFSSGSTKPDSHKRTNTQSAQQPVFDRLTRLIDSVWNNSIEVISIASAGPLDPGTGIVFSAPNIPGWTNFPLRARLEEKYRVPVLVNNDANLAALGEWRYGAGRHHHDLIYLTISTGIGGGVICNDRLITGHRGLATELGHITVMSDGPSCPCGKQGHLEAISSGPAITQFVDGQLEQGRSSVLKRGPQLGAREIAQAARQGDALAKEAFDRAGYYLGKALADFLHIFNPSIVIFGGGVSRSGDLLFDPMRISLQQHVMDPEYLNELSITTSELGDEAGLYGAFAVGQAP